MQRVQTKWLLCWRSLRLESLLVDWCQLRCVQELSLPLQWCATAAATGLKPCPGSLCRLPDWGQATPTAFRAYCQVHPTAPSSLLSSPHALIGKAFLDSAPVTIKAKAAPTSPAVPANQAGLTAALLQCSSSGEYDMLLLQALQQPPSPLVAYAAATTALRLYRPVGTSVAMLPKPAEALEKVQQLVHRALPQLPVELLARCLWMLTNLDVPPAQQLLADSAELLTASGLAAMQQCSSSDIAMLAQACTQWNCDNPALWHVIALRALELCKLGGTNASVADLATVLWCMARAGRAGPDLADAIAEAASGHLHSLPFPALARLVWATHSARSTAHGAFVAMSFAVEREPAVLQQLSPGELAGATRAFAVEAQEGQERLFTYVAFTTMQQIQKFSWEDLGSITWALARVDWHMDDIFISAAAELSQRLSDASPPPPAAVTDLLAAMAWRPLRAAEVLRLCSELVPHIQQDAARYSTRQLIAVAAALHRLRSDSEELRQRLGDVLAPRVSRMTYAELADVAEVFTLEPLQVHQELMQQVAKAVAECLLQFDEEQLQRISLALHKAGHPDSERVEELLHSLNVESVVMVSFYAGLLTYFTFYTLDMAAGEYYAEHCWQGAAPLLFLYIAGVSS